MNRQAFDRAVDEVAVYAGKTRAEVLALPATVFAVLLDVARWRGRAS